MAFPSHREMKNAARAGLHSLLSGIAYYNPKPTEPNWSPVTVREHYVMVKRGEITGLEMRGAFVTSINEDQTRLVFLRAEVDTPVRGAIVAVSSELAYRVKDTEEPDGITIKAVVVRVSKEESDVFWKSVQQSITPP